MPSNEADIRNAALEAGWNEPPLTCPHIDRALASGALPTAVSEELVAIRDINSQLRYGTWYLKARIKELEAEVARYQLLLVAAIDDYDDAIKPAPDHKPFTFSDPVRQAEWERQRKERGE